MEFQRQYLLEGYRRLTFMMLDRDVVATVKKQAIRRIMIGWLSHHVGEAFPVAPAR